MTFVPYPSVRYFRQADGTIGCWTIHREAEEQPDWYDSPVKVPELASGEADEPSAGASPVEDVKSASPAPFDEALREVPPRRTRSRWRKATEGAAE